MRRRGSDVDPNDEQFEYVVRLVFETTVTASDETEAIERAQIEARDRELEVDEVTLVG